MVLDSDCIGLDLGESTTGVARMHPVVKIAEPLEPIEMGDFVNFIQTVEELIKQFNASAVVVGLPRNLNGDDTSQTIWVRQQIEILKNALSVPVFEVDEALTTEAAKIRMKPGQSIDSVAAAIILEDFASEVTRGGIDGATF